MNKSVKFAIAILLMAAAGGMIVIKERGRTPRAESAVSISSLKSDPGGILPRLIDLGAGKCIPCKKMAPILEEIKEEYAGILEVEFIDVWKDPAAASKYGIRLIPTQIFYDASGREITRHEGFMGKDDILGTFERIGIKLKPKLSDSMR
jgi:thioredoxin